MLPPFPFSAIVGQDQLKQALIFSAIQPALGGLLIRGAKGVAKSTAVRALPGLLPALETVEGCPFNREPSEVFPDWELPHPLKRIHKRVPLIELPLGATEDRVLGSIHWQRALQSGRREVEPGLLAAANRGILYVDEVNLLPDHLVDVLLDAAASGLHHLEREGISLLHPARFLLIGTMNPEEGDLRPQLLDRFGLVVDVRDLDRADDRAEAARRRLEYERDPSSFAKNWQAQDADIAERIAVARQQVKSVVIETSLLSEISSQCQQAGAEGLRADLTIARAASARAAYHGRAQVTLEDIDAVAEMALVHRRTRSPESRPSSDNGAGQTPSPSNRSGTPSDLRAPSLSQVQPPASASAASSPHQQIFDIAQDINPLILPRTPHSDFAHRDDRGASLQNPLIAGNGPPRNQEAERAKKLSLPATLRAAAPFQKHRGRAANQPLVLHEDDLRWRQRQHRSRQLVLFVIDGSGSMANHRQMRRTKAAVMALLIDLHRRRQRWAFLSFANEKAQVVLPPHTSIREARRVLENLPVGGATPLAVGLQAADQFIRRQRRMQPSCRVWLILMTDGRANVAVHGLNPWIATLRAAAMLRAHRLPTWVIDTETGFLRLGLAAQLAQALAAPSLPLDRILQRNGAPL